MCGCGFVQGPEGSTLIEVLHNASVRYGRPRKLLTDQDRGFYTWSMEQTAFQRYLDDMEIEHIVSEPHIPQSTGKVERAESALLSKGIDISKGYLVYKIHDHTLSVVLSAEGLEVFLDGSLL